MPSVDVNFDSNAVLVARNAIYTLLFEFVFRVDYVSVYVRWQVSKCFFKASRILSLTQFTKLCMFLSHCVNRIFLIKYWCRWRYIYKRKKAFDSGFLIRSFSVQTTTAISSYHLCKTKISCSFLAELMAAIST